MNDTYVLDTSALIQAYVEDAHTEHVKTLLSQLEADSPPELHILDITLVESANVLWKRVFLFKTLDVELAQRTISNLLALPLIIHESQALISTALTLGLAHGLAVYDALYIALALDLNTALVTADSRQAQAAVEAGVSLKSLTDFEIS